MAVKAATESQLGELHNKVAIVLTNALNVIEKAQNVYLESPDALPELRPEVSAPLLSVMTKFLADNKITCATEDSKALSDLEQGLAAKRAARGKRLQVGNVVPMVAVS